jgi:hypothetical protein
MKIKDFCVVIFKYSLYVECLENLNPPAEVENSELVAKPLDRVPMCQVLNVDIAESER